MIVVVSYYKLKDTKFMNDNHLIEFGQRLIRTTVEDNNLILFETFDNSSIKRIFWAKENEVEFEKNVEEDWSEEKIEKRNKELLEHLI